MCCERHSRPNQKLRRPGRKCDGAAHFENPAHLCNRDLRPRCKHMGELAQHDIELSVVERQLLSISLASVHINLGEVRVFTSALQEAAGSDRCQ